MSADSAVSIAWDLFKIVFVPIKHQFAYVLCSKRYADGLQKEARNLEYEAERVRNAEEEARNNLRNVHGWVPEFLASVAKALQEAKDLLGKFEEASKNCCRGALPDPICRYQFSREAKHKTDDIQKLIQDNSNREISFSLPAPGNVTAPAPGRREGKEVMQSATATASASSASTAIKDDGVFKSRAQIIRDIMDALANNSNNVVGVYGMGGVGKSTLLVDAERRIREEKLFDLVAKADVSENPDIKRIQGEIAHSLGLDIKNEEYINVRAERLHTRLENEEREKKKVLIILDNLWKGLDLRSVGIPCGHDNKVIGCKLLLTSRNRDVLRREMGCDRDFLLGELQEEEAKELLERIVGDKVHVDEFKPLADEALHKCAGVPFLILAIAKRFKDAGLSEWKDTLKRIEMSKDKGINDVINKMLQLSYDDLDEEVKLTLRLCVVYGVSEPSLENLVRYGVGLGLYAEYSSIEEARNRLSSIIRTLQASSLLLENGDGDGFKIHDLVREFVASVASKEQPILVLKDKEKFVTELSEDKLKNCRAICFPYIDMMELPEDLDCPELQMFLLFTNNESLNVPDSLFKSMRKLGVLSLTGIHLARSPSSFQSLVILHTLCLHRCTLDDVAILGKLKELRILSFMSSEIRRLPKEIGQLVELRLLELSYCIFLEIIEPGVLGSLIKLEELYMEYSFQQWNAVEQTAPTNACPIELNRMEKLRILRMRFNDPNVLPEDLNLEKLTKYEIQIGHWPWLPKYKGSRTLVLTLHKNSDVLRKGCIQSILGKTDNLFLQWLNEIEQSICVLSRNGFPKLKHLQVEDSPSAHYILQSTSHTNFNTLESLILKNLINLEKICYGHISSKSFSALKVVRVVGCHKMEVLFPLSVVRELPQLEEVEVVHCRTVQGIVEADDFGKCELPMLRVLKLRDLPNIKNFFTAETTPSSSTSGDPTGTQIAFFNGQQVALPRLETLEIIGLDNLKYMFSPSMVKSLTQLSQLSISDCMKMETIVTEEKGWGIEASETLAFSNLIDLHLQRLESLTCFSRQKCSREARSRDRIKSCSHALFNREATIVGVKKMRLSEFPELIEKWHIKLIPIKSSWQLESLVVDKCPSLFNAISSRLMLVLDNMRTLQVRNCELLEEIFDLKGLEDVDSTRVLPSFETLNLVNLPKLRRIWNEDLQGALPYNFLARLTIYKCSNLRHAFTPSMTRCLASLRTMEIKECGQMEGVIADEEGRGRVVEKISFPNLLKMELECLPNLTSFLLGKNHMLECPNLERLTIAHCPKMRSLTWQSLMENELGTPSLFTPQVQIPQLWQIVLSHMDNLSKIWTDNPLETLTCERLREVEVHNCKSLENLFPCWLATSLNELSELRVESCGLEVIVSSGDDTRHSTIAQVLFPKLTSLALHDMPRLKSFCPNFPTLSWPSLQDLRVTHCDKLNILSFAALMNKWTRRDHEQDLSNWEAHYSFERHIDRESERRGSVSFDQDYLVKQYPVDLNLCRCLIGTNANWMQRFHEDLELAIEDDDVAVMESKEAKLSTSTTGPEKSKLATSTTGLEKLGS
ncbi:putative disease resistance protein RGA3 [Rhodamnia argentea]|uniref:Disease resistance protein RGA3 n=1 Tax=Rhodamnia argentea TaxID=178133 RepID=A0ABM3HGK9_9MYRT|nr:putative disease resistance protein RGA3 [Rhodamnia argentea]